MQTSDASDLCSRQRHHLARWASISDEYVSGLTFIHFQCLATSTYAVCAAKQDGDAEALYAHWSTAIGLTCNLHAPRPALDGQGAPAFVEGHDGLPIHSLITAVANVCFAHVWAYMYYLKD